MRNLLLLLIMVITLFAGYQAGKLMTEQNNKPQLIENYAFVRNIAELASIEVTGTTSLNSTNLTNDGTFTDEFKRIFLQNTVRLSAPYTAKYGVNLGDSTLRIVHSDSVLKIYLPQPRLLSYEIHLDKLEASNQKGWFRFQRDEAYTAFQKKMYAEARAQLEKNEVFLTQSRDRICSIIQQYFAPRHVRTICIYETSILQLPTVNP